MTSTPTCRLPSLCLAPQPGTHLSYSPQGVVTAAVSLITCLCKKNPDDFRTCISLAVSRLSRVRVAPRCWGVSGVPGSLCPLTCLVPWPSLIHSPAQSSETLNLAHWTWLLPGCVGLGKWLLISEPAPGHLSSGDQD